ncbi:MAG: FtsW/RodA/SpoVE family cell cycle protein, partial [Candidatus Limivicinus sp.]
MFFERADIFLLVMCLICSLFGIYMVRIATIAMEASGWVDSSVKCVIVQVFSLFLGLIAFVVLTFIDADLLGEQWKLLCVINILLLVALVIFGQDSGTGNKSWIRFAGIGVQPSEIIKVIYIIVSAKQMTWLKEYRDINSVLSVAEMAGHFVIVFGLIVVVSSDLGSAAIILLIFLTMFYAIGVRLYWFALGGAAVAAAIPLLWTYFLKDYQKKRLIAPYDPSIDPDGWGIT